MLPQLPIQFSLAFILGGIFASCLRDLLKGRVPAPTNVETAWPTAAGLVAQHFGSVTIPICEGIVRSGAALFFFPALR